MPRPQKPTRDLSATAGNPTHGIEQSYQQLMSITDPDELKQAAIQLADQYRGHGMSDGNYRKFMMNLEQAYRRGLTGLQMFLSNYMLKGSGLGVVESAEDAIASFLTESTCIRLTKRQYELKRLVESYGFNVAVVYNS